MNKTILLTILLMTFSLTITACNKKEQESKKLDKVTKLQPDKPFSTKREYVYFSGKVQTRHGKPIESARIEVNDSSVHTDGKGNFILRVKTSNRYVLNIRKTGYGLLSNIYDKPVRDGSWSPAEATIATVDATQFINVTDNKTCAGPLSSKVDWSKFPHQRTPRAIGPTGNFIAGQYPLELKEAVDYAENGAACPPGINIQIPANSLVDEQGIQARGKVDVSVSTVDLFSPGEMPGDFTVDIDGEKRLYMRSAGAGTVVISAKGRPYQLKKGSKATITIPIDPTQLKAKVKPEPTIPLLLYDEKNGIWRPKGTGVLNKQGDAYVAKIDHLSAFNMDILKTDPSCVKFNNAGIYGTHKLEIIIPSDSGAIIKNKTIPGFESGDNTHVLYNMPNNTNISLRTFKEDSSTPPVQTTMGSYMVNTGTAHTGSSPPGEPYSVCNAAPVWDMYEILLEETNISGGCVDLQWNCIGNVFEYNLYSRLVGGLSSSPLYLSPSSAGCGDATSPNTANYQICGLTPSSTYEIYVEAQLSSTPYTPGNKVTSNRLTVTP